MSLAACGGTIADVGDGGAQDAAVDHATDGPSPQPSARDAAPEATPPPMTGQACASSGYACAAEIGSQCPTGSYPAPPGAQDCPSGRLCCKQ